MKIGIIVAMEKELNALQRVFGDDPRYVIKQCGIGKVNAAIGAAEMIREHRPDAIVSSGCAGGNGADLRVQDVVVSTELAYHDVYCGEAVDGSCVYGQVQGMPARFQADPDMLAVAKKLSTLNSPLDPQGRFQSEAGKELSTLRSTRRGAFVVKRRKNSPLGPKGRFQSEAGKEL